MNFMQLGGWWLRYWVVMREGQWQGQEENGTFRSRLLLQRMAPCRPGTWQQSRAQLCGSLQSIGMGAAESEASCGECWAGGARGLGQEAQLLLRERGAPFLTFSPAGPCELMMCSCSADCSLRPDCGAFVSQLDRFHLVAATPLGNGLLVVGHWGGKVLLASAIIVPSPGSPCRVSSRFSSRQLFFIADPHGRA